MNIYSKDPADWKDLQRLTSKFLSEIGYECEIEKDVESVRGIVNLDVYAKNNRKVPHSIVICECKYWASSIPQTIIHSFRTVISDIGANHGFIISRNGFQKGAFEAIKNTNIQLLTWTRFLEYFKENWIISMSNKIKHLNQALLTYVGAGFHILFKDEYRNLNPEEEKEFESLTREYFNTAFYSMGHEYKDIDTNHFEIAYLDNYILGAQKEYNLVFNSYEDFYSFLIKDGQEGIQKFDQLFKKAIRK